MKYELGNFTLDTEKVVITHTVDNATTCDNERMVQALKLLVEAYPTMAKKEELMARLWPRDSISEWSLSRLIANLRMLLAEKDPDTTYIKTIHGSGFRLGVTPIKVGENGQFPEATNSSANSSSNEIIADPTKPKLAHKNKTSIRLLNFKNNFRWYWVAGIIFIIGGFAILVSYRYLNPAQEDWRVDEQISAAYTEQIPLTDWWSENKNSIEYKDKKIVYSPKEQTQRLGYYYRKPALLQNATFEFKVSVDQAFIESGASIVPVAQVARGVWPGEWNCPNFKPVNSTDTVTISCAIDEPNDTWKQEKGETARFSLSTKGENIKGKIIVHSASIHFPMNINVDSGWDKIKNYPVTHRRGVSYQPENNTQGLTRVFKGPIDLRGRQILFTLQTDTDFAKTKVMLQPIAYKVFEDVGMWNCWINPDQIVPSGFMVRCPRIPNTNHFLVKESDYLVIGVQPFGDGILKGSVKIVGISII